MKRILVVDDEALIRNICAGILSGGGYDVETAVNGMDALDKIKSSAYDLIISDIDMPLLNGIHFYLRVERDYPYLKDRFLFLTGGAVMNRAAAEVLSRMNNRVLQKPFKPYDLLNTVKNIVDIPVREYARRKEERFAMTADCRIEIFHHDGSSAYPMSAERVEDISPSGMKVKYFGASSLNRGTSVSIYIKGINVRRNAMVVWTRDLGGFYLSGFSLTEPLAPSTIETLGRTP